MVVCFFHNRLYNKDPGIWFSVNTHTGHIDPLPPNDLSLSLFPIKLSRFPLFFSSHILKLPLPYGNVLGEMTMKCSTTTSYNGVKNGASKLLEDFFFRKKKKKLHTFIDFAQE